MMHSGLLSMLHGNLVYMNVHAACFNDTILCLYNVYPAQLVWNYL